MKKLLVVLTLPFLFLSSCHSPNTQLEESPTELKNNLLTNAYAIDKDAISFSWVMNDREDNEYQTAYNIGISHTLQQIENKDFLYSTGWIESSNNSNVTIDDLGSFLDDDSLYYWVVATKDKNGKESAYSSPKAFRTSVNWVSTKGIWASNGLTKSSDDFCFIRYKFHVDDLDKVEKVLLDITASSPEPSRQYVYNAFVNDEFVGLGPSRIDKNALNQKILYFNTFDITENLQSDNALGIWAYTLQEKLLLFQITAFYQDGSKKIIANSDRDYQNCLSLSADQIFRKDNSIGTSYYVAHANNIDATKYPFGFSEYQFDDSSWLACVKGEDLRDKYILLPSLCSNVIKNRDTNPLIKNKSDSIFIDLKKEIVGGFYLEVESDGEQDIEIRYGEQLKEDGSVRYLMATSNRYVETWKLKAGYQKIENFSMMTYRYVEIIGDISRLHVNRVTGLAYHIPYNTYESYFHSHNGLLNEMYELSCYTIVATSQDIFVDSYSRERRAYEGDAYINQMLSYSMQSNYASARMTLKYLLDNPTWPAEYYLLISKMAVQDYLYTGDISFLKERYDTIKSKNFDFLYNHDLNLTSNGGLPETQIYSYLIDWPEEERDNYDTGVLYNTVFNCLHVSTYEELAFIAKALGIDEDVREYTDKAEKLKSSLIRNMYNQELGAFSDGLYKSGNKSSHYSQHATAYALYCGIFDNEDMKQKMATYLGSQIKMSVYGAYFLINGLYQNRCDKEAFNLLTVSPTEDNYRSWQYIIEDLGATICPEAWSEQSKGNLTLSHPWSGTPGVAIVNGVFGIRPTSPAFSTFDIVIQPGDLKTAELITPCIKGKISVSFDLNNNTLQVNIPHNTKAKLYLPDSFSNSVLCNGDRIEVFQQQGYNYVEIMSGDKTISIM